MSSSPTQSQETMQAWRKHKNNPTPVWETVPIPPCPERGYKIKLLASGVCHSDDALLRIETNPPHFHDTYTLGHEGCGVVVEVGRAAKPSGGETEVFNVGDRVALLAVPGCGGDECEECSRGLAQLCVKGLHHGIGQDGFYAPFVAVDSRAVVRLPDGISPAVAAVATDAVLTAYHGITRRAEVKPDETVFLFGLGGLGFNALQIVHNAIGARVIVSDVREERLEAAISLGVPREDVVPVGKPVQEFVKEKRLHGKIDTVLDFVGMHQTFQDGQVIVRMGGKILCVGTLNDQNTIQMKLGTRKRLSFLFTYGGQYQDLVECLDLIAKGIISPQVETAQLEDFPQVLKDLCDGKIKARMALLHEKTQSSQASSRL